VLIAGSHLSSNTPHFCTVSQAEGVQLLVRFVQDGRVKIDRLRHGFVSFADAPENFLLTGPPAVQRDRTLI
jgi:hypothetical protein